MAALTRRLFGHGRIAYRALWRRRATFCAACLRPTAPSVRDAFFAAWLRDELLLSGQFAASAWKQHRTKLPGGRTWGSH